MSENYKKKGYHSKSEMRRMEILKASREVMKTHSKLLKRLAEAERIEKMNSGDYQKAILKFDRKDYSDVLDRLASWKGLTRLMHGAFGAAGEIGELTDSIKKNVMYGKAVDREHIKEEMGDILFYLNLICVESGFTFEEAMRSNYEKLSKRYPDGYSNEAAMARKDKE